MDESRERLLLIAIWLAASTLAAFMALNLDSAAFVDGRYIPAGNDAFYHAARILDASVTDYGFYQFDTRIHVPEGSWLTWPWAYDYLMSRAVVVALFLDPAADPMAVLAWIPVIWVFVNTGLLLLITRQIGLGIELGAIAVLAYALLPLTQLLHGIGNIDHHFIEQTFALLAVLAGLRFFAGAGGPRAAIALGIVLGAAPAFHNGMFVLQVPVLAAIFVLWIRGSLPDPRVLRFLAASLLAGTVLVLLPSEPFWDGQFEFGTLSWFHLYIAACTAICIAVLGMPRFVYSTRNLGAIVLLALVLGVPLFFKISEGASFIRGSAHMLQHVVEVRSPLEMFRGANGGMLIASFYSGLIFLVPLLLGIFAWRLLRAADGTAIFLSASIVCAFALLLAQFRMHPFGSWALILAGLVLVDELRQSRGAKRLVPALVSLALFAVAIQPSLKYQLFRVHPPGMTADYAATRTVFPELAEACAARMGTVLAYNDDGHYIRYHTDCSVIANNFLLTEQHLAKIVEADKLLQMTPEQLVRDAPQVKYVFARLYGIYERTADGYRPTPVQRVIEQNAPLFAALALRDDLPGSFRVLHELRVDDARGIAYARVFRIER